ncbi:Serine carboxypeptidase [Planctomycetes bacterium Pan216]|uniref:Serine carboxypeptidase n=1 Tax=Kolteria novifilia TaxID=2527975 RepID=A0A518B8B2_9BACT|nr:Serine carboxypeptidase [Planctomycetes bacterium Pan216]
MNARVRLALWLLMMIGLNLPGLQAAEETKEKKSPKPKKPETTQKEDLSVTKHRATIAGREIAYTVTAGSLPIKGGDDKKKASIFFIAYTKDAKKGAGEDRQRPLTFCFNGGPGSSSVWLHLGMLAPVRVKLNAEPRPTAPPYELVENPYSLLDKSDLVFVDPVSTGFSRPEEGEKRQQFHGYREDLQSVGEFIRLYTTRNNRWLSPKFLLGESYGGLRVAGLAEYLQDRFHMEMNGIVLISAVLDFQTILFGATNDLPYVTFFPSYTATAWFHGQLDDKLQASLPKAVAEAEEFALNDYALALLKGDALSEKDRESIIAKMSRLTGIDSETIDEANLRLPMYQFGRELLREKGKTVGRFDSRFVGTRGSGSLGHYDPSASAIFGAFSSTIKDYLRSQLKVDQEIPYEVIKPLAWNYDDFRNRYVAATDALATAIAKNPSLKVFAACGYFDLATPVLGMKHSLGHLGLPKELRENFVIETYEAGHMMYVHEPSLKKLKKDLARFYDESVGAGKPASETKRAK